MITPLERSMMGRDKPFLGILIFIAFFTCFSLLGYGFFSIDEESYTYLTRAVVEKGQFHFETDYPKTHSDLNRVHLSIVSEEKVYSVFPPGYPFLAAPFYLFFGIKGMQIANVFFTVLLVITFYFLVRRYYTETDAFIASIVLLIGTQALNYSVSLWSHIPAAFFILISLYLLFKERSIWGGLTLGAGVVVRYSGVVLAPIFLAYLYTKNKKGIPGFLAAMLIGIAPLLFYNYVSFGSPFTSGMTILNAEEGYKAVNILRIPKNVVTNIFHYTFFPELEFMPDKGSLIETSPFLVFAILGAYIFWREKKDKRAEFYTIVASVLVFILFTSGTWSLGGLAHNMRLLTDIIPLIAFLAVIPLFHLKPDYKKTTVGSFVVAGLFYIYKPSFEWTKFYNLLLAAVALIAILAVLFLRKDLSSRFWKGVLSMLFVLAVGMSIFTAVSTTKEEGANRKSVRAASEAFENVVPESSVIFIFGGEYPTYTTKNYLFLDYRYAPEDIPQVVEYYKDRPIYVIFKDERSEEKFSHFQLAPAGPIRTYTVDVKQD